MNQKFLTSQEHKCSLSLEGISQKGIITGKKHNIDGSNIGDTLETTEYIVEFPDGTQSVHQYSTLLDAIYCQVDEEGDEWYTFTNILSHEQRRKGGSGKTKGWFLQIEWSNGEITWETLTSLKDSNPYDVAKYAQENDLLANPAFSYWAKHVLKKHDHYVQMAKKRKLNNRYKYGIEVPSNIKQALELDAKNGNTHWRDALAKEMKALSDMKVFNILEPGSKPPEGHQFIPIWIIFEVKADLRRKARLLTGGHITKVPTWDCYSSVASKQSVRLAFLAASLNSLDLVMVDVGNAYVNALCKEKVYAIAGPEFGDLQGCIVVIVKALYGLQGLGSAWHAHFSDSLRSMGFKTSQADRDMWLRSQIKPDGTKYYEYLVVYVDDILIVSHAPQEIVKQILNQPYELKGGDAPKSYLGGCIGKYMLSDNTETWYMSSNQYLERAIGIVEEKMGPLPPKKIATPLPTDYHPEMDQSEELGDDEANYYLSLNGILQWLSELGCIDICHAVGLMSRFNALPRKGHLQNVLRIFAYLKQHKNSKLVYDVDIRNFEDSVFTDHNWSEMYPDANEEIPPGSPEPLGKAVQVNVFADAAHADDFITRRSTTGIIIFVNGTPIQWYSKRQNTVESSTYGSEFVAMRIATELTIGLRNDLYTLGFPIHGPANLFCDNQSVVINSSIPSSVLKKKHNSISYHRVQEKVLQQVSYVLQRNQPRLIWPIFLQNHWQVLGSRSSLVIYSFKPPLFNIKLCAMVLT